MSIASQQQQQITGKRICPVCSSENQPGEKVCLNCGSALWEDTRIQTETLERPNHILNYTRLYTDSILLFVMEEHIPIIVKNSVNMITLGRTDPGSPNYHLDLSNYGALLLGVSRIHARIIFNQQSYMIEDLDSTNGTLLNGIRLVSGLSYLLRNGDQLEIGRMKIQLYFHTAESSAETIYVIDSANQGTAGADYPLTLKNLTARLSPFLSLIDDFQTQINRMHSARAVDAGLNAMSLTRGGVVHVTLERASGAIDVLVNVLMPCKPELRAVVNAAPAEMERFVRDTAEKCVSASCKDLPGTALENYVQEFIPLVSAFALSPFEVLSAGDRQR